MRNGSTAPPPPFLLDVGVRYHSPSREAVAPMVQTGCTLSFHYEANFFVFQRPLQELQEESAAGEFAGGFEEGAEIPMT